VALRLVEALQATLVTQSYSRLVIDCNRAPGRPDSVVTEADGQPIPGNAQLSEADLRAREREVFHPYHRTIGEELDRSVAKGRRPVLVSIHSFTPRLGTQDRAWGYGVLHLGDSAFSATMLGLLRNQSALPVGDNAPYAMDGIDYTVPFHAISRGLDYLELEIRQDLIADPDGQSSVATLVGGLLPQALGGA